MEFQIEYKNDYIIAKSYDEAFRIGILASLVEGYTYIHFQNEIYLAFRGVIFKKSDENFVPIFSYNEEYKNFMSKKMTVYNNIKFFVYENILTFDEDEIDKLYDCISNF